MLENFILITTLPINMRSRPMILEWEEEEEKVKLSYFLTNEWNQWTLVVVKRWKEHKGKERIETTPDDMR